MSRKIDIFRLFFPLLYKERVPFIDQKNPTQFSTLIKVSNESVENALTYGTPNLSSFAKKSNSGARAARDNGEPVQAQQYPTYLANGLTKAVEVVVYQTCKAN